MQVIRWHQHLNYLQRVMIISQTQSTAYLKGEDNMPIIIASVVKTMALSFLGNSGVIEKVIILLLRTLAKKTDSTVDDKLVALLEESLDKKKKS